MLWPGRDIRRPASSAGRFLSARVVVGIAVGGILLLPAANASRLLAVGLLSWIVATGPLARILITRQVGRSRWFLPTILALDLATELIVIQHTGLARSPFAPLMSLSIAAGGMLFGMYGGLVAAFGAVTGYWGLTLLMQQSLGLTPLLTGLFLPVLGFLFGRVGQGAAAQSREVNRVRDELERVQLDAEAIVASLAGPLLCLDRSGRIRRINHAAADLLGLEGDLHGKELRGVVRSARVAVVLHFVDEAFAGDQVRGELELPADDRLGPTPVEVSANAVWDRGGRIQGLVLLLGDLTQRKAQEAEQARKERLAVLGELSGHLAHEIRNSLKPVVGSIELLAREQTFEGTAAELIGIILREAESLETFLSDFLFYARDKSLTVEDFDFDELVEELIASMSRHPACGEAVELHRGDVLGGESIQADRKAIRDILRNLILNALEATESGSVVVACEVSGCDLTVKVEDTGAGLPGGEVEELFEPFCTHKAGGTGLGLSIARRLARRMNGEVRLERREGVGTRARLTLTECRAEKRAA